MKWFLIVVLICISLTPKLLKVLITGLIQRQWEKNPNYIYWKFLPASESRPSVPPAVSGLQ